MRLFHRDDGRYYAILEPVIDLLGDRILITYHGSIHNRMGGVKSWPTAAVDAEAIVRIRLRHGYREITGDDQATSNS